ncbi:MAG: electron transfer flavoprotein subunit beta/FixA family protein [Alphaproteobacteria bacterium]|nr:electron transfer flavoprotein subunit beta/FixA family protein [Alphaproteobacteria bacterium]NCQ66238.1 electron transfer flavoprotein subunit beta/FixA family protein [Alphaproteobacteria bacterium]NCT06586.1 electron transfer flavoprotein subunit beta/FixA family protein [Alphaproteobacteria bacterium]
MKALVCVKRVLDYNIKARVKSDESGIDLSNVKMSVNPFDEIAVEEAVRLKEAGTVAEIVIVAVGEQSSQEVIRAALALGGDRGILVQTSEEIQPLAAAKIFKALVDKEAPDLVFLGKQAIDDDCNQTGQMLASLLNWSQGTFASKIAVTSKAVTVTREVDGGLETISCTLPAVLTTDLRLNTPRYPKLPNIMKAKQKPLETFSVADLGVEVKTSQKTLKVCEPPVRKGGRKVKDVQELINCLRNDAKVI